MVFLRGFLWGFTKQNGREYLPSGSPVSGIRAAYRLTVASLPRFPLVSDILLSKAATEN